MPAITEQSLPSGAARSGHNFFKMWLPIALFGVLWADLVRQLSYTWEASEQYAFGWFVPIFALGLFWKRWMIRPASQIQASPFWLTVLVVAATAALLPLRVVFEINPDWPLCSWVMALTVVGISLYAVFLAGGWKWVRHFAFPVGFILVAVQWPYRIEHGLTEGLMRVVAALTVELLGWFNIPAFQHGNLIEVSTGVVGISEACSGIRSFQATLMAALFLGELYQLRWMRRFLLLAGGVTMAFSFNVLRTLILAWHASSAGIEALEKWHDPAGLVIFIVSFACLWVFAIWLHSRSALAVPEGLVSTGLQPSESRLGKSPTLASEGQVRLRAFLITVGCWAILCLAATELWYRAHEVKNSGVFHWSVVLPEGNPTFQKIELAPRTSQLLGFDVGATGRWQEADGSQWSLYFFRWNPASANSIFRARAHRPDVCLPSSGLNLVEDGGVTRLPVGGLRLPFHRYVYESEGRTLQVFFCEWEDSTREQTGLAGSEQSGRVLTALKGRRHLGQQTLEFILSGYPSLDEASNALTKNLPQLIKMDDLHAAAQTALK